MIECDPMFCGNYQEQAERIGELASLLREAAEYIDGIINRCYTVNVAHGRDLLGRMADLGIETEGGA